MGEFIMLNCKEIYKMIYENINRKDKINELETIFCQNKNDIKQFAANFYKAPIVNYKGYVNGKKQEDKNRYSEVISSALLSRNLLQAWKKLSPVRANHFDTDHTPYEKVKMEKLQGTNRKEEILAKLLFYQRKVDGLGYIFDYQTPLKKARNDSYGKIDLLGYNVEDKCYSVIELKYRPSGSDETLLRCVLEAYTYYKLFDLNQIESAQDHNGITELRALKNYKHIKNAELVILFDEKSRTKGDGGDETNLMLRIYPKPDDKQTDNEPDYPSKTVVAQQYKECQELIDPSKRKELRALCKAILKQEPELTQIRFVVLQAQKVNKAPYKNIVDDWSESLDRAYQSKTLLTIIK